MNNKKVLLILVLVFVLLMGGAYVLYTQMSQGMDHPQLATQPQQTQPAGASVPTETQAPPTAPDFTVYDREGNAVKLSDYVGKPIVLNFWASWCGPCQSEMPDFQEKFEALGEDVQFLMVNMTDGSRETVDIASAFIEEQGFTFPVLYDTDLDAANTYGAYSLPTTYFIDSQGAAIARATGAIDGDTLQRGIDMITP